MLNQRSLATILILSYFIPFVVSEEYAVDACELNKDLLNAEAINTQREAIAQCNERVPVDCSGMEYSKFRTIDGRCNNLQHPTYGKSPSCSQRILPPDYADGKSRPRRSCTGKALPNARFVSNMLHRRKRSKLEDETLLFMEWGQIMAHDFSLNDVFHSTPSRPIECCKKIGEKHVPLCDDRCHAVKVPPSDPFYTEKNVQCINIVRTIPCPCKSTGKREALNQNSPFYDLTLVYGKTDEDALSLRTFENGKMITSEGNMPPKISESDFCESPKEQPACYKSGDPRTNHQPFLLSIQIVLLRHHNFLCEGLLSVNPHWDDERLYQEARRINIANAQLIISVYLVSVLGKKVAKEHDLFVQIDDDYTTYDPSIDPTIFDEFASVAARYGHFEVPNDFSQVDKDTGKVTKIHLRDYYGRPFDFPNGQFEKTFLGMSRDPRFDIDDKLSGDVRNYLYRRKYLNETYGGDLAAVSIVRGREHGIPGYTHYLAYLFNYFVKTFDDLKKYIPENIVNDLQKTYRSVHDIDFYTGVFAERLVEDDAIVGPTVAHIIGLQNRRLKYGDRYWFEHKNQPVPFTYDQLKVIKNRGISEIICQVSNITYIQEDSFLVPSKENPIKCCHKLKKFEFEHWKESI